MAADVDACVGVLSSENHYEVLQVTQTSSDEDIRKNYLKISLRVHPDRNGCPDAKAAFQRVSEAYETLKSAELRGAYDAARAGGFPARAAGSPGERVAGFDLDAALRVFAAAAAAAEAAAAQDAGVPEYVRLATTLLDVKPDTEGAALLTMGIGGAVAACRAVQSVLPRPEARRGDDGGDSASVARGRAAAATTVAAVGAAALFGLALLNAAAERRGSSAREDL